MFWLQHLLTQGPLEQMSPPRGWHEPCPLYEYSWIRGAHKFLALKELFHMSNPYIILLQESMHSAQHMVSYFRKTLPEWHIATTDSIGPFGGLVALWNPRWVFLKTYSCFLGILLAGKIRDLHGCIHIRNIYAPIGTIPIFRRNWWI